MVENEVVAAILSAVLTAYDKTAANDVTAAIKTYHACLIELQNFGVLPPETRWSATAEHARLNPGPASTAP